MLFWKKNLKRLKWIRSDNNLWFIILYCNRAVAEAERILNESVEVEEND